MDKITSAASPHPSGLWTVPAAGVQMRHLLRVPSAACPFSRNPVLGAVVLRYAAAGKALEVVALHRYLRAIVTPAPDHPRSVEALAARIAVDASAAVGARVQVDLWLLIRPWQVVSVRA